MSIVLSPPPSTWMFLKTSSLQFFFCGCASVQEDTHPLSHPRGGADATKPKLIFITMRAKKPTKKSIQFFLSLAPRDVKSRDSHAAWRSRVEEDAPHLPPPVPAGSACIGAPKAPGRSSTVSSQPAPGRRCARCCCPQHQQHRETQTLPRENPPVTLPYVPRRPPSSLRLKGRMKGSTGSRDTGQNQCNSI